MSQNLRVGSNHSVRLTCGSQRYTEIHNTTTQRLIHKIGKMPATSKKRYHPTSDSNRISKSRRDVNGGDLSTPGRRHLLSRGKLLWTAWHLRTASAHQMKQQVEWYMNWSFFSSDLILVGQKVRDMKHLGLGTHHHWLNKQGREVWMKLTPTCVLFLSAELLGF